MSKFSTFFLIFKFQNFLSFSPKFFSTILEARVYMSPVGELQPFDGQNLVQLLPPCCRGPWTKANV